MTKEKSNLIEQLKILTAKVIANDCIEELKITDEHDKDLIIRVLMWSMEKGAKSK